MQDVDKTLMADFPHISFEEWQEKVTADLKGVDLDRLSTETLDGFSTQPLYMAEHAVSGTDAPGEAPYRRSTLPSPRTGDQWDMRQRHCQPDPALANRDILQDLGRGVRSLWLQFDRATRLGEQVASGDGLFSPNLAALKRALVEVDLSAVGISLAAGANTLPAAASLIATAKASGVGSEELHGALNFDPLGSLAKDGSLPYSTEVAEAQMAALSRYCIEQATNLRAVGVDIEPHHNAGASQGQEIGFALATGVHYLRVLTQAGLSIDEAALQINFTVSIGSHFFSEIAKLRAMRQTWAQVVATCGGNADAQKMVVQASTSAFTKTKRDPYVNMLRTTTEAFAAAVGGVDALNTSGFDTPFGPSDLFSRRIASNAQVVLNEESHVARVADPAGGSYFVESLTNDLAAAGYKVFQEIEADGGMHQALLSGSLAKLIEDKASQRNQNLAKRKQAITGVNEFANLTEKPVVRESTNLKALTAKFLSEDTAAVELTGTGSALVLSCISAVESGTSHRRLTQALAGTETKAIAPPLLQTRQSVPFEALRNRADSHEATTGAAPTAFLCNLGAIPKHKARASFASGFLNAGGIAALDNDGFAEIHEVVAAFAASRAPAAVICGSDDQYPDWLPELAPALKKQGAEFIVVAGRVRDKDQEAAYRKAGVDTFIYMGCDVLATLTTLHAKLGVAS